MKEWNEFAYRHESEAFVRDSVDSFNRYVRKKEKQRKLATAIKSFCVFILVLTLVFAFTCNESTGGTTSIDLEHSSK